MDTDYGPIRDSVKSISDRMETGHSSLDQNLGTDEVPAVTVILPITDELLRQNSHHCNVRIRLQKNLYSPLQHCLAAKFKKLLGPIGPHPAAASCSHYDHIFFPVHFS